MADADGHPEVDEYDLTAVLHALADDNRRSVIAQLAAEPPETEQFCSEFGMPWAPSTRTHHFRVLRKAGLIWQRDVGNGRMTRLRRDDMDRAFPGLLDTVLAGDSATRTKV
ncbi:ArsR/SmtB family transcription factor [Gordonia soli]|uniref:Putative ArsR family transcriptional regulator n=1 Tax=Gordonia soli NBRC 108243 TaxID=1223545 RepID=M0QHV3_9ACTN|nr:helix-turn-helix transcriptional regulator [Gordonia soli]GAC67856.1 putative ArsR family transcriptional regulator [Gordonia soli NBRC 108243]